MAELPKQSQEPSLEPGVAASRFRPPWRWVAVPAVALLVVGGITATVTTRPDGAACMSNPAMIPDTAGLNVSGMPRVLSIEDLPAPGPVIALGDAMALRDSDEMQHEISVLGADDLKPTSRLRPADGRRLVSVLVRERNVGQTTIIPQGDDHAWLCDSDGTWYQHDATMTVMLADAAADRLDPRLLVDQRVVFQLRANAQPSRVRIIQYGHEWTKVGDWELD